MEFALLLHLWGVVIWVGGMFFAYTALRPTARDVLDPPQRLTLWVGTFRRFFPSVWLSVAAILGSGLYLIMAQYRGFAHAPVYIHAMLGVGVLMMLIFGHVFFAPYRRLRRAVAAQDWPAGARQLAQLRVLIGINLLLGLTNIAIALLG
ncbi:MAG: CopD family protein [Betaproteobacteria bacterium]|nr:CopD family protein [Betaproteobacteria bacterium]